MAQGSPDVDADTYAVTSSNRLVAFERETGAVRSVTNITGITDAAAIVGIDFRPADGKLYALSASGGLYTIDAATAAATAKASLAADSADATSPFAGLVGQGFGVNFNPVADRLRVVSNSGQNLRINVDTGATTTDGALNPGTPAAAAAAYSNSFASACRTRLYVLDTSTRKLLLQDPPNAGTLTEIADLGLPASAAARAAFEVIADSAGNNLAMLVVPADSGSMIYDLNLTSGALENPRELALAAGETIIATSAAPPSGAPPQAPGELLGVSVSNKLVSFNRGAPGKLCTQASISGLQTDEDVLGIDVRPADGNLYGLGSTGRLYTLGVATGVATLKSTLMADPMDTSAPFSALPEGEVGIGFNPVPDRLRVVSRNGDNLRINVDTGVTVTDAALTPTSMAVTAVAYTNAFAGATSTTLYAVDTGTSALITIGGNPATADACPALTNPNCGNVTSVGALGVAQLSGVDGLDIDGDPAATGTAFLALRLEGSMSSSLYLVDLATGAAAPPAGVANPTIGGGEALRELTLGANPAAPAP